MKNFVRKIYLFFPPKKMSLLMNLVQLCKSLTPEDIQTVARNRELLGELGKEFVPKHFLKCGTCGAQRTDVDELNYFDDVPKTCPACENCGICKQPREMNDQSMRCVNENCTASPLWVKKNSVNPAKFGTKAFGLGFRG
jgi:hypothetical protein